MGSGFLGAVCELPDNFSKLTREDIEGLVGPAMDASVRLGFDSCTAPKFEQWARQAGREDLLKLSESCESGLFSAYISAKAQFFPCSFSEGLVEPINVLDYESFTDVWYHPQTIEWRKKLLGAAVDGCRRCPLYPEINP